MQVGNMKRAMAMVGLTLALSGCGESGQISEVLIGGKVIGTPPFQLPGPMYALKASPDRTAPNGTAWAFEPASWKPKGWSLWVTSNVYSAYVAPKNDQSYLRNGFGRAESAIERSAQESLFLGAVSRWTKANKVALEINFLGYDAAPLPGNWAHPSKGYFLTHKHSPCDKAFRLCVNNYFASPVLRQPESGRLAFKDWIAPFLVMPDDESSMGKRYVIAAQGGQENADSPFFDWWPTMVFLVNPEGSVVRAWLPQKNDRATANRVKYAIITEMGGKYAGLKVTDDDPNPGVPAHAYYGKDYIHAITEKMVGNQ